MPQAASGSPRERSAPHWGPIQKLSSESEASVGIVGQVALQSTSNRDSLGAFTLFRIAAERPACSRKGRIEGSLGVLGILVLVLVVLVCAL